MLPLRRLQAGKLERSSTSIAVTDLALTDAAGGASADPRAPPT